MGDVLGRPAGQSQRGAPLSPDVENAFKQSMMQDQENQLRAQQAAAINPTNVPINASSALINNPNAINPLARRFPGQFQNLGR